MIDLEAVVLQFLERREDTPGLSPEVFADEFPQDRGEVLRAVQTAVSIETMLPSQGDRGPQTIAGYSILEEIGRGGMGIVYRAEKNGELFALKVLPNAPLMGPRALERFRREAAALSRLTDSGIVKVHEASADCDVPYIVMDLVRGAPLHTLSTPMDASEAVVLVEKMARTIHTVHEQGIVHRDLKPQNVLLLADGTPVILDFGLSGALDLSSLTATGDVLGTPRYMAPEQMLGGDTDRRTDVYALGLVLYELVTGRPARPKSVGRLAPLPAQLRVRSPRRVRPGLPRPIDVILRTALATDPDKRYATALALAEDLRRCLDGAAIEARSPGPWSQAMEWVQSTLSKVTRSGRSSDQNSSVQASGPAVEHAEVSRQTEEALDRTATAWLDGDDDAARRELATIHRLSNGNMTAQVMESFLHGQSSSSGWTPSMSHLRSGLELLQRSEHADALGHFEALSRQEFHAPLIAAVTGLSANGAGRLRLAERELVAATRRLTDCVQLHAELAQVHTKLSRLPEAEQALLHATALSPGDAALWRDLASVYDSLGNLDSGLKAVERAIDLTGQMDAKTKRVFASLKDQGGEGEAARALLRELAEDDPNDHVSRHLLGLSWDREHRIGDAAAFYREAVEIQPAHPASLINLAYLHSGALTGKCKKCDQAYAENPACLDLGKAEDYLIRALEADGGSNPSLVRTAMDVALRLEDRSRLISCLEELTGSSPKTPESLQLEQVLRTLRITG